MLSGTIVRARGFSSAATPVLTAARAGGLTELSITRPKALNALSLPVIHALRDRLVPENSSDAAVVCLQGSGGKAFCAGGDIKLLAGDLPLAPGRASSAGGSDHADTPAQGAEQFAAQLAFFSEEYQLDAALARCSLFKPWMAVWDGIVMGGGVGISIHLPIRVATEATTFAMPETGIGFFPDVGGSYWLPRLAMPGLGQYLALAGARVKGAEAVPLGIATHYVPSAKLPELKNELARMPSGSSVDDVAEVVSRFQDDAAVDAALHGGSKTLAASSAIERCFTGRSVEAVLRALAQEQRESTDEATAAWASRAAATLARMCPTSLKVTHEQLRRGAALTRDECYRMELHVAMNFMARPDFYEGVRALLVDKDNSPKWAADSVSAVDPADVQAHFEPVSGVPELSLLSTQELVDMAGLAQGQVPRQ